jgi:hypothetical protein
MFLAHLKRNSLNAYQGKKINPTEAADKEKTNI